MNSEKLYQLVVILMRLDLKEGRVVAYIVFLEEWTV